MCRLLALLIGLLVIPLAAGADEAAPEDPAFEFLASIEASTELEALLETTIDQLRAGDPRLRQQKIRVSVIDIPVAGRPRIADWNGDSPVYPASVPKFVYLMAAYAWRDQGILEIDPALDRQLEAMIHVSSNRATQKVFHRLTATEPGPRLGAEDYAEFARRRHAVKRWLQGVGIRDLHTVHPTYDGGGDLYGRDLQFLEDKGVEGCLPDQQGPYFNRQAMTANGTARLLALLAEDLALNAQSSAEVRERMRRDPRRQPYQWKRISGAVDLTKAQVEVFSKTGTWGPIFADAGIIRHASGHQVVVAVFVEGQPAYRGLFIPKLVKAVLDELLFTPAAASFDLPRTRSPRAAARG